jgi:predicted lipid-binding transport protein (Tim44 family)
MSFTDRLVVWFHIGFVIFAIGPVTIATLSTPRYIRARNVGVLRYLSRMTRIFGAASLGVLLFGIIAGQSLHDMTKTWVTASLTLFVVALVLLVLIMRDQHKAIAAVEGSLAAAPAANTGQAAAAAASPAVASPAAASQPEATAADVEPAPAQEPAGGTTAAGGTATGTATATRLHVATVERGRIASLAGVVALIWLVILVLMVWRP